MMSVISSNELRDIVREGLGITPSRKDLELFGIPTAVGPQNQQAWEPKVTVEMLRRIRESLTPEELETIDNHQRGEQPPESLVRKVVSRLPGIGMNAGA